MTASRFWGFGLVVSGILSLLTLLPLGALKVFEFKTVDVRFWVREILRPAPERQFVQVIELAVPSAGRDHSVIIEETRDSGLMRLLESAAAHVVWVVPPDIAIPDGPQENTTTALWGAPERLSFALDTDGVLRRVPLLLPDNGKPSLVLSAVCSMDDVSLADVRLHEGAIELRRSASPATSSVDTQGGVEGVVRRIPVDRQAQLLVNFANRPAPSAWQATALEARVTQDATAIRSAFQGRLVLLGWGSRGPRDGSAIPLARVASDLEIAAEAVETILAARWIHRPHPVVVFLLTWVLMFFGSQAMMRLPSWRAITAGFSLMLLYVVLCNALFVVSGVWLDLLRPLVAFQMGAVIFPVFAYRWRTRQLVDQMRLLRRFDDLVLMNVAKGLLVAGRHGMVVRHNPHAAELLGLAGQSLHGRHIRELLAVSPAMLALVGRAMAEGEAGDPRVTRKLPISTRVSLSEGDQERVLELEVALVDPRILHTLENEDLPCYVLTFDDVTQEVHRAKEEAQRARLAAMGEIAAKLGHEIRNSLGGLRLYVDNIREDVASAPSAQRAVDGMVREIESLYRKIDELRQYGSVPKLHREACDLKELMQEAIHYAHRRLGEKNVTAVLDCERSFPPLMVDRRQLREAFVNLINNAIDAAPPGGRVEIYCDRAGDNNGDEAPSTFRIHIEDNGPGIPEDIRDQVFSLFFTTKEDTGTGLGLPMVKKIVESHGGSVFFTCEDDGGTRFTVILPAVPAMKEVESLIDTTTKIRTLVVDDNRAHRDAMLMTLERLGHQAEHAISVEEACQLLQEHEFDVVIVDMELPRARGEAPRQENGLDVVRQARASDPDAAILAITGFASVENAVQAMQAGASEYITKGRSLDEIRMSLKRALEGRNLRRENRRLASENLLLRNQAQSRYGLGGIIGTSSNMQDLFNRIAVVAPKRHTVLVRGESGTGKELVARAIHYNSDRRDRAMFTINCTALSSQLIESELFGHKKGSFTGASEDRKGLFEESAGSTLFLDEIGDLPLDTQPKLLRAIELKEFKRVGENVSRTADVRIVAATNRDLLELVHEGRFREDLYARLEVITLMLPALRQRKEDIPLLVQHFVQKVCADEKRQPLRVSEKTLAALMEYGWPRNVRELENVLTQAILFCAEDTLEPQHLQLAPTNNHPASGEWLQTYTDGLTLREAKEKIERELVQRALDESQGNISRAAESLGMQRPNLYRKLREFGLEPRSN